MNEIEKEVMKALEKVIDPELGVDIVNLGLIYGIKVDEEGICNIKMTLTIMGCPLSEFLNNEITKQAEKIAGVKSCKIKLVWYPAWDASKMSRAARIALGVHL
ncbi:metal-sulfur cluster assembly factor [Lactobacillus sp. LL6]|uniref:metal-sulfur cluster assembly factor n=1 Tax=Lactobacillus sp. LL6 TaxID=2596827 RepID=UPI001186E233|nr:metal-sulfur cluster assembly factor [Lactobacillus sp. LL6]TSO25385.1 metal-sulfur cluster assembly factor [Lactobacillus sp. LL6]